MLYLDSLSNSDTNPSAALSSPQSLSEVLEQRLLPLAHLPYFKQGL
jgi:hypothetical protein